MILSLLSRLLKPKIKSLFLCIALCALPIYGGEGENVFIPKVEHVAHKYIAGLKSEFGRITQTHCQNRIKNLSLSYATPAEQQRLSQKWQKACEKSTHIDPNGIWGSFFTQLCYDLTTMPEEEVDYFLKQHLKLYEFCGFNVPSFEELMSIYISSQGITRHVLKRLADKWPLVGRLYQRRTSDNVVEDADFLYTLSVFSPEDLSSITDINDSFLKHFSTENGCNDSSYVSCVQDNLLEALSPLTPVQREQLLSHVLDYIPQQTDAYEVSRLLLVLSRTVLNDPTFKPTLRLLRAMLPFFNYQGNLFASLHDLADKLACTLFPHVIVKALLLFIDMTNDLSPAYHHPCRLEAQTEFSALIPLLDKTPYIRDDICRFLYEKWLNEYNRGYQLFFKTLLLSRINEEKFGFSELYMTLLQHPKKTWEDYVSLRMGIEKRIR